LSLLGFATFVTTGCGDSGDSSGQGGSGSATTTNGSGGSTTNGTGGEGGFAPPAVCGDGDCGPNEVCGTCADDCGACTGTPIQVTRGPYLQSETEGSIVVRWRTAEPSESIVAFGPSGTQLDQVRVVAGLTVEHEVKVSGLTADTKSLYAFGTPESALVGGDADHFWTTAPKKGAAKPTRMWVLGDSGTANGDARDVRDAYVGFTGARGQDLLIMLGDNAYNTGTDAEYQAAVFDMYPDTLRNTVLWATLGNHDGGSADSATQSGPYYDNLTLPKAGEAGGVPSGTEAYYAFDYGQVHFVCLDSYESDRTPAGDMLTWLESDLAANDQPWLVAFWHHPPYSKGSHDSDTESQLVQMRQNALPILESHGVDLVLGGHSHAYERSFLLNGHYGLSSTLTNAMKIDGGDGQVDGDGAYARAPGSDAGAVYIVAGSSGQKDGGSLDHPAMFVSMSELGSLVVDVDGGLMDVTFIDEVGATRDYFTLSKN
jgi:hypothetical protein